MSLTHLVNISQIGWSTDRIPLFKKSLFKEVAFLSQCPFTPIGCCQNSSEQQASVLRPESSSLELFTRNLGSAF